MNKEERQENEPLDSSNISNKKANFKCTDLQEELTLYKNCFNLHNYPNDIVRQIGELVLKYLKEDQLEIEFKLGSIIDQSKKKRLDLSVLSDTVIKHKQNYTKFETKLAEKDYFEFERNLNQLENSNSQKMRSRSALTRDLFYEYNGDKVRLSVNQDTNEVIRNSLIIKKKKGSIDILTFEGFDIRASVNIEEKIKDFEYKNRTPIDVRFKNRTSYRLGGIQIDLTKVSYEKKEKGNQFELEVELFDLTKLKEESKKLKMNQPNNYFEIIETIFKVVKRLASLNKITPTTNRQ